MKTLLLICGFLVFFLQSSLALKGPGYVLQSCRYPDTRQYFVKLFGIKEGKMMAKQEIRFEDAVRPTSTPVQWVDTHDKIMVMSDYIGVRQYVKTFRYKKDGFQLIHKCDQDMLRHNTLYWYKNGVLYSTYQDKKTDQTTVVEWEDDCSSYEEIVRIQGVSRSMRWDAIVSIPKTDKIIYTRSLGNKEINLCWFSLSIGQPSLKCQPTQIREADVNTMFWDEKESALFINGNSYNTHRFVFSPDYSTITFQNDIRLKPYYCQQCRNNNGRQPYYMHHFSTTSKNRFYNPDTDQVVAEYPKMADNDQECRMNGRSMQYETYDPVPFPVQDDDLLQANQ